jgi:hypothetical protein
VGVAAGADEDVICPKLPHSPPPAAPASKSISQYQKRNPIYTPVVSFISEAKHVFLAPHTVTMKLHSFSDVSRNIDNDRSNRRS